MIMHAHILWSVVIQLPSVLSIGKLLVNRLQTAQEKHATAEKDLDDIINNAPGIRYS